MRKFFLGLALGALLVAPLPLVADHIIEPAHPITELTVELYWYNHLAEFPKMIASSNPARQTRCDGSVTADFKSLRVEPKVVGRHADGTSLAGDPTEHWRMGYQVRIGNSQADGPDFLLFWGGTWNHQNTPPHGAKASTTGWEAAQTNIGIGSFPGRWALNFSVIGDVSGTTLTAECRFNSVTPTAPTTTTTTTTGPCSPGTAACPTTTVPTNETVAPTETTIAP